MSVAKTEYHGVAVGHVYLGCRTDEQLCRVGTRKLVLLLIAESLSHSGAGSACLQRIELFRVFLSVTLGEHHLYACHSRSLIVADTSGEGSGTAAEAVAKLLT